MKTQKNTMDWAAHNSAAQSNLVMDYDRIVDAICHHETSKTKCDSSKLIDIMQASPIFKVSHDLYEQLTKNIDTLHKISKSLKRDINKIIKKASFALNDKPSVYEHSAEHGIVVLIRSINIIKYGYKSLNQYLRLMTNDMRGRQRHEDSLLLLKVADIIEYSSAILSIYEYVDGAVSNIYSNVTYTDLRIKRRKRFKLSAKMEYYLTITHQNIIDCTHLRERILNLLESAVLPKDECLDNNTPLENDKKLPLVPPLSPALESKGTSAISDKLVIGDVLYADTDSTFVSDGNIEELMCSDANNEDGTTPSSDTSEPIDYNFFKIFKTKNIKDLTDDELASLTKIVISSNFDIAQVIYLNKLLYKSYWNSICRICILTDEEKYGFVRNQSTISSPFAVMNAGHDQFVFTALFSLLCMELSVREFNKHGVPTELIGVFLTVSKYSKRIRTIADATDHIIDTKVNDIIRCFIFDAGTNVFIKPTKIITFTGVAENTNDTFLEMASIILNANNATSEHEFDEVFKCRKIIVDALGDGDVELNVIVPYNENTKQFMNNTCVLNIRKYTKNKSEYLNIVPIR